MHSYIRQSNVDGMREFCKYARDTMPNLFNRQVRAKGFSLHLGPDGKRVDIKTPGVKPTKTIFCIKKEDKCRRCGYEYTDVRGEPKERECLGCKLKHALKALPQGSLPGISYERESATTFIRKTYMDQARSLVGSFPVQLSEWNCEVGIQLVIQILIDLDGGYKPTVTSTAKKIRVPRKETLNGMFEEKSRGIFAGFNAKVQRKAV
jgi:hypothetical protein